MNWWWVINWIASIGVIAFYMNSSDKSKKHGFLMVAFAGWFLTATVLMQQPSSLRGFINEAKEIVCGEQGLTSLDSMECKSAIVNTINGN